MDAVAALEAQKPDRIAESSLMAQFHQALNMVEHGDEHGALVLTTHLLEQHPDFVPALKLQGMLLEDTGRPTEAALSVRRA